MIKRIVKPLSIIFLIAYMYYIVDDHDLLLPKTPKITIKKLTTNRTNPSIPIDNADLARHLHAVIAPTLEMHLQNHYVICMHHLEDVQQPYRFCAVKNRQPYYLMNPVIIGGSTKKKLYQQNSVCWNKTIIAELHDEVFVQWDHRELGNQIYLLFEGNESIAIQIAMEEFNCHHKNVPIITSNDNTGAIEWIDT